MRRAIEGLEDDMRPARVDGERRREFVGQNEWRRNSRLKRAGRLDGTVRGERHNTSAPSAAMTAIAIAIGALRSTTERLAATVAVDGSSSSARSRRASPTC